MECPHTIEPSGFHPASFKNVTIQGLPSSKRCHSFVTVYHCSRPNGRFVHLNPARSATMKSTNPKTKSGQTREGAAYLAARAAEAEKQAEAARRLARLAKSLFKEARKAFKQAKKFAKQARKEAKAAAKALKQQLKRGSKGKKTAAVAKAKPAPKRALANTVKRTQGIKSLSLASSLTSTAATPNSPSTITQA